ncbi:MAG: hypothetical protein HC854_12160 [Flavobacterium sp.]|nr:hypothetical protein [Flavobacterium sp.]
MKNNFQFVESSSFFKDKNLKEYILNELDSHPNGLANTDFAEILNNHINKNKDWLFQKNKK